MILDHGIQGTAVTTQYCISDLRLSAITDEYYASVMAYWFLAATFKSPVTSKTISHKAVGPVRG